MDPRQPTGPAAPAALRRAQVLVPTRDAPLQGMLSLPEKARGVVVFVHGSGSTRFSPRNAHVAATFEAAGLGTLLFDLLSPAETEIDNRTLALRFDIELLSRRLVEVLDWLDREGLAHLAQAPASSTASSTAAEAVTTPRIGLFGASTGAAAALIAAAQRADRVAAVVSRGGRPDLAGSWLPSVRAPTLLIVGGNDPQVIMLNRQAAESLRCPHELHIVPGATHLFEEPGALDEVARMARDWFLRLLG